MEHDRRVLDTATTATVVDCGVSVTDVWRCRVRSVQKLSDRPPYVVRHQQCVVVFITVQPCLLYMNNLEAAIKGCDEEFIKIKTSIKL